MTDLVATGITVDAARMRAAAREGFATATDLADYLVRKGVPFRDAHEAVARAVRHAEAKGATSPTCRSPSCRRSRAVIGDDVFAVLTLEGSVASRNHPGGTAPAQVRAAVTAARARSCGSRRTGCSANPGPRSLPVPAAGRCAAAVWQSITASSTRLPWKIQSKETRLSRTRRDGLPDGRASRPRRPPRHRLQPQRRRRPQRWVEAARRRERADARRGRGRRRDRDDVRRQRRRRARRRRSAADGALAGDARGRDPRRPHDGLGAGRAGGSRGRQGEAASASSTRRSPAARPAPRTAS